MKKMIIKVVKILLCCTALVLTISCKNGTVVKEGDTPTLNIVLDKNSRTVFPDMEITDFTSFAVEMECVSSSASKEFNFTSVSELQYISLEQSDVGKEWHITITASKGDICYSGENSKTIQNGDNSVTIKLGIGALGSGNGSLAFTLDYTNAVAGSSTQITKADVVVSPCDDAVGLSSIRMQYGAGYANAITNNKIIINRDNIPAASYNLEIRLYTQNDVLLYVYPEVIQIAKGETSTGSVNISKLNPLYTVNFVDWNNSITTKKLSRFTKELPALSERTGYEFVGWYTDAALKNPVQLPLSSDITLYASWISSSSFDDAIIATKTTFEQKIAAIGSNTTEDPAEIKFMGPVDAETFEIIKNAMEDNSDTYVSIDFSEATGFTELNDEEFKDCTTLIAIVLPKTLDHMVLTVFRGCTNLQSITVAEGNKSFMSENGVLYSKDKAFLALYPAGKKDTTFEVPEETFCIMNYAFENCSNLTTITFEDTAAKLYESSYFYDSMDMARTNASSISIGNDIVQFLKNLCSNYFYSINFARLVAGVSVIPIYNTLSYSVGSGNYTIMNESDKKWYKLETTPGKEYTVYVWDIWTSDKFTDWNDGIIVSLAENITYGGIDIYDANGNYIAGRGATGTVTQDFTATTTTTYINVHPSNYNGRDTDKWGFRIVDKVAAASTANTINATVTVIQQDVEVSKEVDDPYIIFNYGGNLGDTNSTYKWYCDGSATSTERYYYFRPSNYIKGTVHTIMFVLSINGVYYSYTAQVKVE